MTFKKLVIMIDNIKTKDDVLYTWAAINKSFEADKISWNDHELLYDLASKIYALKGWDKE